MLMLQTMVMREVQKEHSCTKTLWLEGRGALRLQKRHGRIKERTTRQDACLRRGVVLYYSGSTFGFAMEQFISLSLSPVYAVSVL